MNRALPVLLCCAVSLSCCGDSEKLTVPPLPQDGSAISYPQVLSRLAAQTDTAKESHFLNRWDAVVDGTLGLEQSAGYLLKSPDVPAFHKVRIEKSARELTADILALRESARRKDQVESLEMIRRIHNRVRDLQELK